MRTFLEVAVLALLTVTVFNGAGWTQTVRNQTVFVAVSVDATSMDPWLSTNITDKNVVSHLYDTLLARSDDMSVRPNIAVSYRSVSDTVWEFQLRRDVKFTNGDALTARDVQFTLQYFRDPKLRAPSIVQFMPIESVEVVNDYAIRFKTSKPFPALPAVMTEFWIVPKRYTESGGTNVLSKQPIGSGPYTLLEWARDSRIVLRANPGWWAGEPKVRFVGFTIVPDQNTRIAKAQTGEADIIAGVPAEAVELLENNPRLNVVHESSPRAYFVALNQHEDTPLRSARVRQALNHAVNVEGIIASIFAGRGRRLATLLTPEQFGFDAGVRPFAFDQARARQLLVEAGYPNGFAIDMEAPRARYPKDVEVAQIIAAQLGQIGVRVNLVVKEWGDFVNQFRTKPGPSMFLMGWSIPTFDPDAILTPLLTKGTVYGRFAEPRLENLIEQARSITDVKRRAAVYREVQAMMKDLAPMIFLYQLQDTYAVSKRLNWKPRADERIYLWGASFK
jgi:peptide/nickel transport system substrate-binding protein